MTVLRRVLYAGVVMGAVFLLQIINGNLQDSYQDMLIQAGVAITLAVSLNIVNGFTGQFSIGHAGFMAVGAYTAGVVTTYVAQKFAGVPITVMFILALAAGAAAAALAGLLIGLPSLRLRGDYLAVATLGFGQ